MPPPPPPQTMTPYQSPPPVAPQTPPASMPVDPSTLSVEEQARMFREMMAQQQQQQQQQQPGAAYPPAVPQAAPPTPRGPTVGVDGRRVGRNRDADAVVTTADVYFAQLKRDSSIRNIYRSSGDEEKANAVFEDPGIEEIKIHVNPYIE